MPKPITKARPHYRRARSDSEKSDRRQAILAAADAHVREAGFDEFSMVVLARRAGIAKGTLYLYFETREEVLLSLYAGQLEAWCRALTARVHEGISDQAFAAAFLETAEADPVFLDLSARLGSVIEHNVSIERLVESKRAMRSLLLPLAAHFEHCLGLAAGKGAQAVAALTALLLGASQVDAGPSLQGEQVPADVREMIGLFRCREVFLANAPLLLAGARRG